MNKIILHKKKTGEEISVDIHDIYLIQVGKKSTGIFLESIKEMIKVSESKPEIEKLIIDELKSSKLNWEFNQTRDLIHIQNKDGVLTYMDRYKKPVWYLRIEEKK